jgi:hypothetical protein
MESRHLVIDAHLVSIVGMALRNDFKALVNEYRFAQDDFNFKHMERLHLMIEDARVVLSKIDDFYGVPRGS